MQFRRDRPQDIKDTTFKTFGTETSKFSLDEREVFAYRWNNISSTQLHYPCGIGQPSISGAKICNFSSVGRKKKELTALLQQI